jgi:hypothetical protein
MANQQLQQIADSALLRVGQYLVTGLMVPGFFWFGGKLIDRLEAIERAQYAVATQSATFELRVQALERGGLAREEAIRVLREQNSKHEYELRRLQEIAAGGRGLRP